MRSIVSFLVIVLIHCTTLVVVVVGQDGVTNSCQSVTDCETGWDCIWNQCINKGCMTREMRSLSDGTVVRDQLLQEAGVTQQDLFQARTDHIGDLHGFVQSAPAQAFLSTIQAHSQELQNVARIIQECADAQPQQPTESVPIQTENEQQQEEADEEQGGIVARVGAFLRRYFSGRHSSRRNLSLITRDFPNPNQPPSTRPPSRTPTASPTFASAWKYYIGFHMEAGALLDASYSIVVPFYTNYNVDSDLSNTYARTCIGAEVGVGAEVSLIVLALKNKEANDIIGPSFLMDTDVGAGPGLGLAFGYYTAGDMHEVNGNNKIYFEATFGAGAGFGIAGASLCRTEFYLG